MTASPDANGRHLGDKNSTLYEQNTQNKTQHVQPERSSAQTDIPLASLSEDTMQNIEHLIQVDPPLVGQPARFTRELTLPPPPGFIWPKFDCLILASHSCVMRETWAAQGASACSVADRRTVLEPSEGCLHVIGDIHEFLEIYPHDAYVIDAHPTCSHANKASSTTWKNKIMDGSMLASALEIIQILHAGDRVAVEQPPSAHEFILGKPQIRFKSKDCGEERFKSIWYWTRNLPWSPAEPEVQCQSSRPVASKILERDPERRMLLRSITYPKVAAHLYNLWHPKHWHSSTTSTQPKATRKHQCHIAMAEAKHQFSIFAATYAPKVSLQHVSLCSLENRQLLFVIPVATEGGLIAHIPKEGLFGANAIRGEDIHKQAKEIAACLNGVCEPIFAGFTRDASAHAIFTLPSNLQPTSIVRSKAELDNSHSNNVSSCWCSTSALAETPLYESVLMAVARLRTSIEAVSSNPLKIGSWDAPVPVVPHRLALEWREAPLSEESTAQWKTFLKKEKLRAKEIAQAWIQADTGDGYLSTWATSVKCAADFVADILPPPQGLPDFSPDILRLAILPPAPPPLNISWLHSLPPQHKPPGFPVPVSWTHVLKEWARRKVCVAINATAKHDFEVFEDGLTSSPRPPHVLLGPGAFFERKCVDGIGTYGMNAVILECKEDGLLWPMDFDKRYKEHRDIDFIRSFFGGKQCGDQELLAFLAEGSRFKTHMPKELRLMHNLESLQGRGPQAAATIRELVEAGAIHCRPILSKHQCLAHDGPCPLAFIPGSSAPIGGVDKKDDPSQARMVLDNSAPHSSSDRPVRVRNHPHGEPDGAHALDMNASTGEKTKGPKRSREGTPHTEKFVQPLKPPVEATHVQIGHTAPPHVTDIRRRGPNSDAANPFLPSDGVTTKQSREACIKAMKAWYDEPDNPAEEIASRWKGIAVASDYKSYEGHVLVRAIRRFAGEARRGVKLTFGCSCPDLDCHRFLVTKLTNEMATEGDYFKVPHPFPDPELKMRPRDTYAALACLNHMAHADNSYLVGFSDDVRWMFYQFWMHACEYAWCMFLIVLPIVQEDGSEANRLCICYWKVMNMGTRPSSKIACRFSERWLQRWRTNMDIQAAKWVRTRSPKLQSILEERRHVLGPSQARPFWAGVYTDDFQFYFISVDLAVIGVLLWNEQNSSGKITMCKPHKKQLGTVVDAIGARNVLNGGFGCTIPSKRARAIVNCSLALQGKLSRDEFESNNGLLVHLQDILDLPIHALHGISRPLKLPGFGEQMILLTQDVRERYTNLISLLQTRSGAVFLCAVPDAKLQESLSNRVMPVPKVHMASDACTDAQQPAIFGIALGIFYYLPLDREWLCKSINVLEAAGRGLNYLVLGRIFDQTQLVNEGDNISALASGLHRAKADDLRRVQEALERCESYSPIAKRSWECHVAGIGNELADAGSRSKWKELHLVAATLGVRLKEVHLKDFPEAISFLRNVLKTTSSIECRHQNPPIFTCEACNRHLSAIERCLDVCPACTAHDGPVTPSMTASSDVDLADEPPLSMLVRSDHSQRSIIREAASSSSEKEQLSSASKHVGRSNIVRGDSPCHMDLPQTSDARSFDIGLITHAHADHLDPLGHTYSKRRQIVPASSATARMMAFDRLATELCNDTSEFAILPDNPQKLKSEVTESLQVILAGIPPGTLKSDDSATRWAAKFCTEYDTPFLRPVALSPADMRREQWLWAKFAVFCATNMRPRSRSKVGDSGKIISNAKPSSAYGPVCGWRRILRDAGHELPSTRSVAKAIKGETQRFKRAWGQKAMVPIRRRPFSQPMLQKINAALSSGNIFISSKDAWSTNQCILMRALFLFGLATGERADSLSMSSPDDGDYWRLADLRFVRDEKELPDKAKTKSGDLLRGRAPPSKCDRDNMEWGDRDMWFRLNPSDPLNFAQAWLEYRTIYHVQGVGAAAFSPALNGQPFKKADLQKLFNALLSAVLGEEEAKHRSWHALRVTAATALNTAKRPDGAIQCLLRWKTLDAMRLYAKMDRRHYADLVEEITTTRIDVTQKCNLPTLDHFDVIEELESLEEMLGKDETTYEVVSKKDITRERKKKSITNDNETLATNGYIRKGKSVSAPVQHRPKRTIRQTHNGSSSADQPYSCISFPTSLRNYVTEQERPSKRKPPKERMLKQKA